jgi:hypothetical protein
MISIMKFSFLAVLAAAAATLVASFAPLTPPAQPAVVIQQVFETKSLSSLTRATSLITFNSDITDLEEKEIQLVVGSNPKELVKLEKDLEKEVKLAEKIAKEDARKARIERGKVAYFDYEAKKQAEEEARVRSGIFDDDDRHHQCSALCALSVVCSRAHGRMSLTSFLNVIFAHCDPRRLNLTNRNTLMKSKKI